jgi:hypothetical protein
VSAAGSDSTGDGTSGNPWATLSQALTYLNSYSIGSGVSVIINIGDGTFDWANTTVTHKDANRITITGTNSYAKTISSIQSSSGSAGAYSIILNLNNVTNVVVGDYALISGCTGGTRPETLMGCWAITNVDEPNNRITVASTSKYSSAPSGAVAGTATVVKTVIRSSTAGTNVLALSAGANLANITKIVLVGNSTGRGVSVSNANFTATAPFGIVGCLYGYLIYGNGISGFAACMASGCTYGVYVWSSVARMNNGIFSGNTTGVYFTNSNGECYAIVCGNTTGMDVVNASYVYSATSASVVSYNTGTGMWCHNGSYITAVNSSVANNGTNVSPTADTIANNNSYIQVAT